MSDKTTEELVELQLIRQEISAVNEKLTILQDQLKDRVTHAEFNQFKNSCDPIVAETIPLLRKLERSYKSLSTIINTNQIKEKVKSDTQKQMFHWIVIVLSVLGGGGTLEILKHLVGTG